MEILSLSRSKASNVEFTAFTSALLSSPWSSIHIKPIHIHHTQIVLQCTQFSVQLINQKKNNKKSQSLDIHLFYCDSRITPSISRLLMFGRMCYVCIQFFRRRRMAELTLATDRKFFHYSTRERETQSECAHVPQMSSKVEITTVLCVRRSFE